MLSVSGPVNGLKPLAILSAAAVTSARVAWRHSGAERRDRHHLAQALADHRRLECPGDHAFRRRGHERTPGEAEPGDPALRRQRARLERLEADRIVARFSAAWITVAGESTCIVTTSAP